MLDQMNLEALPRTREEFENRAILFHVLMDLREFLEVKQHFLETHPRHPDTMRRNMGKIDACRQKDCMHYLRMAGKYDIMGGSHGQHLNEMYFYMCCRSEIPAGRYANGHAGNFYEQKGI